MSMDFSALELKLLSEQYGMDLASGKDMTTVGYGYTPQPSPVDKMYVLSGPQSADTGELVMKMMKEHEGGAGKYELNWDFKGHSHPIFDNWPEPDKMATNPKKGPSVLNLKTYRFGSETEGTADMKDVLGGKGAGLCEMSRKGFPVPPGFIIPCEASVVYNGFNKADNAGTTNAFMTSVMQLIANDEHHLFQTFGYCPLVSVRSGARVSMPGMMDTILNVGINDDNLAEWEARIGKRGARDSYRRFLQMYGTTALGIEPFLFEDALQGVKIAAKVDKDSDLSEEHLASLVKAYKDIYATNKAPVPKNRLDALRGSIKAVFESWNNQRAKDYRKSQSIPDDWGTAVVVQAMVFGNVDDKSCSGVAFSRDKKTGEVKITGEFLVNAQGEDVVAGIRTPESLATLAAWNPKVDTELRATVVALEQHYKDMQDVEFTVQSGKLWMLQCRPGKRSALAAFNIAYDMVKEGLITKEQAMDRVSREQLLHLMSPQISPDFKKPPDAIGLGVGGGVVTGKVALNALTAIEQAKDGSKVILVRNETDPDDFAGMMACVGILTATGGTTSHAAVVANGFDKTCVVGCKGMNFGYGCAIFKDSKGSPSTVVMGNLISIDGATGRVWLEEVPVIEPIITEKMQSVARWFMDKDYAHRITPTSASECSAQVQSANCEVLYVDTCFLKDDDAVEFLGVDILKSKAKRVVLDLSFGDDQWGNVDRAMNKMFGSDPLLGRGNKRAIQFTNMIPQAATRCVLKLPAGCTIADALRKKGFKVYGPVKTVADLLDSDSTVSIDDETIAKVFGSKEALLWIQEAMGKAGKVVGKPLPDPAYWYEGLLRKGANHGTDVNPAT